MSSERSLSVAVVSLFLWLLVGPTPAGAAPENRVAWSLAAGYPGATGSARGGELGFPCGTYGRFDFKQARFESDDELPAGCGDRDTKACGTEKLQVYPSAGFPDTKSAAPAGKDGGAWLPCRNGSCFTRLEELQEGQPWVAVIDWNDLHGWSVGWTILHLANTELGPRIPVVLFDLYDQEALLPFTRLGATDVHVLKQLCRIAEVADRGNAPRVINMSFGRIAQAREVLVAGFCDPAKLSCQIAHVLRHLACGTVGRCPDEPRTVPVAAAGNERFVPMFPAVLAEVVAAGSLQLELYGRDGTVERSWETPDYAGKARALVPGYGLCLEDAEAGMEWPTPPGSSYAAAVFSGWLAEARSRVRITRPFSAALWFPRWQWSGGEAAYSLVHGIEEFPSNSQAVNLINRTLGPELHACASTGAEPGVSRRVTLGETETLDRLIRTKSFLQMLDSLAEKRNAPMPPDRPCVSCVRTESASPPGRAAAGTGAAELSIDMAASAQSAALYSGLPDLAAIRGIERQSVYLRVEKTLYRLTIDGRFPTIPADTGSLVFPARLALPAGEQPSLIYFYRWNELEFWTSTPILLRSE